MRERGERARFLRGRLERGSAEVGIDSGICSDILEGWYGGVNLWFVSCANSRKVEADERLGAKTFLRHVMARLKTIFNALSSFLFLSEFYMKVLMYLQVASPPSSPV